MGYKQKGTLGLEFSFSLLVCMTGKGAQYVESGWDVSREPGNRVPKKSFIYNCYNMRNIKRYPVCSNNANISSHPV